MERTKTPLPKTGTLSRHLKSLNCELRSDVPETSKSSYATEHQHTTQHMSRGSMIGSHMTKHYTWSSNSDPVEAGT